MISEMSKQETICTNEIYEQILWHKRRTSKVQVQIMTVIHHSTWRKLLKLLLYNFNNSEQKHHETLNKVSKAKD